MNVLHLWSLYHEELKYHIHYLAKEMMLTGDRVALIGSDKIRRAWQPYVKRKHLNPGTENHDGLKVHRLAAWSFSDKPIPISLLRFYQLLKQEKADIVHVFSLTSLFNYIGLLLLTFIHPKTFVIVANDHSNPVRASTSFVGNAYYSLCVFLFQCFRRQIKRVFVPNQGTRELIMQRFRLGEDVVKVIPLGYDGKTFYYQAERRNNSNKLIIGFAGKVDRDKRVEVLLEAVKICSQQKGLGLACIIAGVQLESDYGRELQAFATLNQLEVEFKPMLSSDALAELYGYIDVAIFPGSISITTVEASGCGSPVVVYKSIAGLEDRVEQGRGNLFEKDAELVELIEKFYALKQANKIDHAAIAQATKKYTWKAIAQIYKEEYQQLLTSSSHLRDG